jgi:hypothetical protein
MSTKTASIDLAKDTRITDRKSASLPITRDLTLVYASSLVIALIMTAVSVAGLLHQTRIYPAGESLYSFIATDALNFAVGLPVLLGSMWLARRGKLIGLLCWPGALLYVLYRYIANLLAVPFGVMFMPYLFLVILSAYTLIGLVANINSEVVRQRLTGAVPAQVAGGILIGATVLFIALDVSAVVTALASQPPSEPEHPVYVLIADFTTMIPMCLVGGFLLWRREALGYVGGVGLLLLYSILLIGPVPILVFSSTANGLSIPVVDILFLLVMASICLIPLGLFVRGIVKS